ncbi:MAG: lamin tail domain-containing protein, partial [Chloroflexi bacterium]|nr:lamin tail domain-containing protein [Chloroflexota bacterium]
MRTRTSTIHPTATATPSAPAHVVISEFRSRGQNGLDDEFVELYNPSGAAVNMGAWMIKKSSSCGTGIINLVTIPADTMLLAGQHYLAAATGSSVTSADQIYPASLADDGGVALVTNSGTVVDAAGMCTSTQYHEGTILLPLVGTSNQSYERKPGGATSCYDTNDNARDFALISPANPQNKANPIVMCAG